MMSERVCNPTETRAYSRQSEPRRSNTRSDSRGSEVTKCLKMAVRGSMEGPIFSNTLERSLLYLTFKVASSVSSASCSNLLRQTWFSFRYSCVSQVLSAWTEDG